VVGLDRGEGPTPQCEDAEEIGVPHETDGESDRCHVHRPQREKWVDTNGTAIRRAAAEGRAPPEPTPWMPRALRPKHQPFLVDRAARSNQLGPQQLRDLVEASKALSDALTTALNPTARRPRRADMRVDPRWTPRREESTGGTGPGSKEAP
jgi:hypothetical protein